MRGDRTIVEFRYTNHKGETAIRRVRPIRIWFGTTAWHPEAQWFLEGFDLDKQETRDYAMSEVRRWYNGMGADAESSVLGV